MHGAGGCDFAKRTLDCANYAILWAAMALPSVVALTPVPKEIANPALAGKPLEWDAVLAEDGPERLITCSGDALRVHLLGDAAAQATSVVLPLDQLFEVRVAAALRLWRGLNGRSPGRDPAILPQSQRDHFVLSLRALDAKLEHATYRDIAKVLFGVKRVPDRSWKTHDLRDRTIRIVRLGLDLMQGGYHRLLLHPFRRRL